MYHIVSFVSHISTFCRFHRFHDPNFFFLANNLTIVLFPQHRKLESRVSRKERLAASNKVLADVFSRTKFEGMLNH